MRIVYPEGTESLLDLCQRQGAEIVWRKLANGSLQAFQWRMEKGEFIEIDPSAWARIPTVIETGGEVVKRHPVEFLEQGDLSFIGAHEVAGKRIKHGIGDDPVLIDKEHARALFPRPHVEADQGGRPEHPARAWYAERDYDNGALTMKQLQREMEKATGVKAPSESAIRKWKKDAQKPPTKT